MEIKTFKKFFKMDFDPADIHLNTTDSKEHIVELMQDYVRNFSESEFDIGLSVGDIWVATYHRQECCENVYADWSLMEYFPYKKIDHIEIKVVDGVGFLLNGHLINCYNEQNGYYSSNLKLIIGNKDEILFLDDLSKYEAFEFIEK